MLVGVGFEEHPILGELREVFARIAPLVDADTKAWLEAATAPI